MKKRILRSFVGLIVIAAFTLPSCEFLESCGECELVTNNDGEISTAPPIPLCGDALIAKQDSEPTTLGDITTYYNCY
jgi:hypothetical protein